MYLTYVCVLRIASAERPRPPPPADGLSWPAWGWLVRALCSVYRFFFYFFQTYFLVRHAFNSVTRLHFS